MLKNLAWALLGVEAMVAQQPPQDPGVSGPDPELVHQYFDEWPTGECTFAIARSPNSPWSGIAVSSSGRLFSNYPLGLDAQNTRYQVAELNSNNTETPYPNAEINAPPGGAIDYSTYPASSVGDADHFVAVQSVVIDAKDRLWVLDTGRVSLANNTLLTSQYGGPKLVQVDLSSNSVVQTILFPPNVSWSVTSSHVR
jgi:hypothetical protein